MLFEITDYQSFKRVMEDFCAFLTKQKISAEQIFDSRLAVHELLANVLQHTSGGARLRAELVEDFLQISLQAEQTFFPPQLTTLPSTQAERGRGLYLIDRLAERRVVTPEGEWILYIRIRKKGAD